MKLIDLHVHSNMSDGTMTPTEIIYHAFEKGLAAVALTDHNTIKGIPEALEAALGIQKRGVDFCFVPGVEITAFYKCYKIHILGLDIDYLDSQLHEALDSMFEVLDSGAFAPKIPLMTPEMAIQHILKAKGIPVLAHPYEYKFTDTEELNELVFRLKRAGILGIETMSSKNSEQQQRHLEDLSKDYNLIMTGGSDFHGERRPRIEIGVGYGNLRIPYDFWETLQNLKAVTFGEDKSGEIMI
jgi:hypothetical protein